uniref:Uncharacterized protein n=1 Tax=Dunaliella tertiolecta TaxID=3047 RepID=A0A7S3R4G3_DUNTE|eukprot:1160273-Pelagomonas_calceolata.AAC.11
MHAGMNGPSHTTTSRPKIRAVPLSKPKMPAQAQAQKPLGILFPSPQSSEMQAAPENNLDGDEPVLCLVRSSVLVPSKVAERWLFLQSLKQAGWT